MATRAHDLDLPDWGPYGKVYAGCSHIADLERGLRWDFSVFPAFFRGRIDVPAINWDSGWAPAAAAPDLSAWAFRSELEGRALTVESAYAALPGRPDARLCTITCRNRTDAPQTLSLHLVCGARYPAPGPCGHDEPPVLRPASLRLPAGGAWCDGRDHAEHASGRPRPDDGLVADGRLWGEFREDGCVDGGALRLDRAGDRAGWTLATPALAEAELALRLRAAAPARLRVQGRELALDAGGWRWLTMPLGTVGGALAVAAELLDEARVDIDVVAVVPAGALPLVAEAAWDPVPEQSAGPCPDSLVLRYPDLPRAYGLRWSEPGRVRRWRCDRLDLRMRFATHDHVSSDFRFPGFGQWTDVVIEPVALAAGEERTLTVLLCVGDPAAVAAALAAPWPAAAPAAGWRPAGPEGAQADGQRLMAATLLTNTVFPIYTRRRYVRHIGPGKTWDSLYFWDSGFNGIGLSEVAPAVALDILQQYLMPEGDRHAAWLHHGSPVPVMVHLAQVLWNRGADRARLAAAYPGLRQLHRFLAGRHPASRTDRWGSRLLATWDHFYNSGGWDDYPPQLHVHAAGLAGRVAPMVTACQVIRSARLLRRLGRLTGHDDDGEYAADIARLAEAVQAHAWDAESGWFGYVDHDADGRACGLLRHASGANFNMGADGCYPLVAGICRGEQEARLVGHLSDPHELWSDYGVTTVSRSAPYYRPDGYWNGTVWMPHQWFFWRALLDHGHADLALRIAETALATWTAETARSGRSWEHFPIVTGRGAGWHHFGALSAPVLAWHAALHTPGRLTGGADLWLTASRRADGGGIDCDLQLDGEPGRSAAAFARLDPGARRATFAGAAVPACEVRPGLWQLTLPASGAGRLCVQ